MERPRYGRPRCEDCDAQLTFEEVFCGDGICTACYDLRVAEARQKKEAAERGERPAPSGHIDDSVKHMYE